MSKKFKSVSKAHRRDFLLLGVAGVTAGIVPFPGSASAAELHNRTTIAAASGGDANHQAKKRRKCKP
jgi:hypothetical protein